MSDFRKGYVMFGGIGNIVANFIADPSGRQLANMRAQQKDQFEHSMACQLASGGWYKPSGTVERINGKWRAVFEAPTRIPRNPKHD